MEALRKIKVLSAAFKPAHKDIEKALQKERERAEKYFHIAGVILVVIGSDKRVVLINEKGCEVLGYKPEEIIGKDWFESFLPERIRAEVEAGFQKLISGDAASFQYFENSVLTKSGEERIIAWDNTVLTDEKGNIAGTLSSGTDMTERRRSEEAMQHRMDLIKLITGISTHFINLPPDEIDSGATYALQEIGEFSGVDRSYIFQLYNKGTKMDNTHEWCAEGIEPHIHRLKGLSVDDFSWHLTKVKKGEVVHIPRVEDLPPEAKMEKKEWQFEGIKSLIVVPMIYGAQVIGFVGFDSVRAEKTWDEESIALLKIVGEIFSNALKRKLAEEALRESEARYRRLSESLEKTVNEKIEELQQAQRLAAIGEMVSTVAHEVKNPLQNIKIGVDAMHNEIGEDGNRHEILEGINHGIYLLDHLITNLLEYAKPVVLKPSSVTIGDIVDRALKTLAHKLANVNTHVELEQDDRRISVDPVKFTAVIVNLVLNAVEAMTDGGGNLWIRSRFFAASSSGIFKVSITDSGCGISRSDMQRIQKPFVTTKSTGTGLGIPICKKIVEAHGGTISISSKINEGTTVEVSLPV